MGRLDQLHRISITGVESTGKSTLAQSLGSALNMIVVEECARYDAEVQAGTVSISTLERLGHEQWERCKEAEEIARKSGASGVISDTDAHVLMVWSAWRWNHPLSGLEKLEAWPQFTLLCSPTIPWVPDALRSNPDKTERAAIHQMYVNRMEEGGPWALVNGNTKKERLEQSVRAFNAFVKTIR